MTNVGRTLETLLTHRLRAATDAAAKRKIAEEALANLGPGLHSQDIEIMHAALKPTTAGLLAWAKALPSAPDTAYLCALFASELGTEGAARWEHFFSLHAGRDPLHLLAHAQALAADSRFEEAADRLRMALAQPLRYSFFPRSERLIASLAARVTSHSRECRIAVLGTSTTSLMIPILRALCLRDRIRTEFYEGLYGAAEREILDSESGLARFRPFVVFLVTHWRDLALPPAISGEESEVRRIVEQKKVFWRRLSDQFGCYVVQFAIDFPGDEPHGYLAESLAGGRSRVIAAINLRMREEAPAHVSILDAPALQREVGIKHWEDPLLWHSFKQHPGTEALPALAELQQAHLRALLGLARKVLVTDLDNTLWKGVIGEDGLTGIQIGPGSAAGEAHQRLQQYMLDLKSRGILLAVCSKNNPDDARLPFEKHEHMRLRVEDFAAFVANWEDKASNLCTIAAQLSLGLDSFVFLDDNQLDRDWVRAQLPQVAVIDVGPSVFHYVRDLDRGRHFFTLSLSEEDLARASQYRSQSMRESIRASAQSMDEFLAQLHLKGSVSLVAESNLSRVTQLVNKTNQFNLTTRRYTEAQVRQFAEDPNGWAAAFQLSDRMGSYGLIGVMFCRPVGPRHRWEIDTWLMSCRTLGRQMEHFMFDRLLEAARERGIREIAALYRATGKNALVAQLCDTLGFTRISETPEEVRYLLAVPEQPAIVATHIHDCSSPRPCSGEEVVQLPAVDVNVKAW